jgi:hypothetical protein
MKRFTFALALGLGLMMNACGSSGSNNSAQSTCQNTYGQTVNGSVQNGVCIQSSSTCTPCAGGFLNPQNPAQCLPQQYAAQMGCGQNGGIYGNQYGYGQQYYYPQQPYYGGGYYQQYPIYYGGGGGYRYY